MDALRISRRGVTAGATAAALVPLSTALSTLAAEPEPMRTLTEEEMAARVARKAELAKQRKGKRDPTVTKYGGDYQKGVRGSGFEYKPDTSPNLRKK